MLNKVKQKEVFYTSILISSLNLYISTSLAHAKTSTSSAVIYLPKIIKEIIKEIFLFFNFYCLISLPFPLEVNFNSANLALFLLVSI